MPPAPDSAPDGPSDGAPDSADGRGTTPLVIAIDGPAASGKGTLARRLAEALGFAHLDTGLTFRAVAHALLERDLPLDDEATAAAAARELDLARLDREALAQHHVGEAASRVAVMHAVREALLEAQRRFAREAGAREGGAVLDGRDIGTVVWPEAPLKLYVTASAEERARRRWNETVLAGGTDTFESVLADIRRRDARDAGRDEAPLRPAADAHLLDTTRLSIDEAFREALDLARPLRRTRPHRQTRPHRRSAPRDT